LTRILAPFVMGAEGQNSDAPRRPHLNAQSVPEKGTE
jgi:hypothetical protein